ncbi:hypothetical protein OAJ44_03280 [Chloroflexi bacterium]|nr:hypothetical protein [Chloroflexota bacterium]
MDVPILFAFTAGTVAAFNPCGAAMFPAYVGFHLSKSSDSRSPLFILAKGLLTGITLAIGFVVVFGIFGILMAVGFSFIGSLLPFIGLSVGVFISVTGCWLLITKRSLSIALFNRLSFGSFGGMYQIFLFGIAYALASLSCALPVFLSALGIVIGTGVSTGTLINVVIGSFAYSLGMGLIMMSVTIAVLYFEDATQRLISMLIPYVEIIGKLSMVVAGAYIAIYWLVGDGSELLRFRLKNM